MPKRSSTLFQISTTYSLAQNFFVMFFAGWVIYFFSSLCEGEFSICLSRFAILCTPVGLAAFSGRYNLIASAYKNGIGFPGRVTQTQAIGIGKRCNDYVIDYPLGGQTYECHTRFKKHNFVRLIKVRR